MTKTDKTASVGLEGRLSGQSTDFAPKGYTTGYLDGFLGRMAVADNLPWTSESIKECKKQNEKLNDDSSGMPSYAVRNVKLKDLAGFKKALASLVYYAERLKRVHTFDNEEWSRCFDKIQELIVKIKIYRELPLNGER
jgi:hypothetical protein